MVIVVPSDKEVPSMKGCSLLCCVTMQVSWGANTRLVLLVNEDVSLKIVPEVQV